MQVYFSGASTCRLFELVAYRPITC